MNRAVRVFVASYTRSLTPDTLSRRRLRDKARVTARSRSHDNGRGTNIAVTSMGPPLPSRELGHVTGGKDAAVTLAVWLDYACPFCKKFYDTFTEQVLPNYGDQLKFVVYHQVQPWHPQSTMMHEAAIAVTKVGGEEAFWKFSKALYAAQTDYFDANTWDKSRAAIYAQLCELAASSAGVAEEEVLALLARVQEGGQLNAGNACTQELKFHVKLGRQTGVHVSPTTLLNGMVCDTSSGWSLDQWKEFLDPHVAAAAAAKL